MANVTNEGAAVDEASAHRQVVRDFSERLTGLHKQALWMEMPVVAHFIGVAALSASETYPDQVSPLGVAAE